MKPSPLERCRLTRDATRAGVGDVAAILAQGFLRLTQTARNSAVSQAREPQIVLELSRRESPPVAVEPDHGGDDGIDAAR